MPGTPQSRYFSGGLIPLLVWELGQQDLDDVGLVQYLTHPILQSYTWVKGGNPFWVGNETAPYNNSTKNGLIRPHQGNLYILRPCSFQIWSLFKKLTIIEEVMASIPWRSFHFNTILHAPKCCWLRDFLIFNVKIHSQIFSSCYQNLSVLKYKQIRQISQWQIFGSQQKYIVIMNLFRIWLCHTLLDILLI